jgi:hypothetical protein
VTRPPSVRGIRRPWPRLEDAVGPQAKPGQAEVVELDESANIYRVVAIHDDQPAATSAAPTRKPKRDWLAPYRLP